MSHLSSEEREEIKVRLQEVRKQLRQDIRSELLRSDDEHYADLAGQVHDSGDESVADLLVDIDAALISQHIRELREVEAALERSDSEAFGCCEVCGEAIPFARLQAYPSARLCVTDQERAERAKAEGHPSL